MKITVKFLSVILALTAIFTLTSCTHEHVFGEWSGDETGHVRACDKCDETEAGTHTFDEGVVTVEPKALEAGEKTYTCTLCGYSYTEEIPQKLSITLEEFETFDTHTSLQKKYLADKVANIAAYADGTSELSYQGTPYFKWTLDGLDDSETLNTYMIYIGMQEDLSDAKTYKSRLNEYDRSNGFNFYIRTKYYWKVEAIIDEADGSTISVTSETSSFTTLDGPRTLYVSGVANVRDLGGKDCEGGVLRQGILFRCGRFNSNYTKAASISATGKKTMLEELGIKSEIDLRAGEKNGVYQNGFPTDGSEAAYSWIDKSVKYYFCPGTYSSTILSEAQGKTMIKNAFTVLADPDNYPVVFHCSIGTDRTGMVAFLTEGICGCSYEDMERDYLFSNFGNIGSSRAESTLKTVTSPITAMQGSTIQEKCVNYLLSCGITQEQIDSIKNILIEKTN